MSNGLAIPGRVSVDVVGHPGPCAQPIVVPLQKSSGLEVHVFGGLTPLQHVAAIIAGGKGGTAAEIVDFAQAVLDECAKREKEVNDG